MFEPRGGRPAPTSPCAVPTPPLVFSCKDLPCTVTPPLLLSSPRPPKPLPVALLTEPASSLPPWPLSGRWEKAALASLLEAGFTELLDALLEVCAAVPLLLEPIFLHCERGSPDFRPESPALLLPAEVAAVAVVVVCVPLDEVGARCCRWLLKV